MAAIITPPGVLFAASLTRPVLGWFVLSVTYSGEAVSAMSDLLRRTLLEAFNQNGQYAPLPMTDLGDGRWVMRFVSRQVPSVVNADGWRLIVEPAPGSLIQVVSELRPMVSGVGIIPTMQQIKILNLAERAAENQNSGTSG